MIIPSSSFASVSSIKKPVVTSTPALNQANLTTTQSSGGIALGLASSAGYIKIEWWDGTTNVIGNGTANSYFQTTKDITSPYNNTNPKNIVIYSCTSGGARSGNMYTLNADSDPSYTPTPAPSFTNFDVKNCTNINGVGAAGIQSTLDVSNLTSLNSLTLSNSSSATSVNISNCSSLITLALSGCNFSSITSFVTGLSSNTTLQTLYATSITGLTSINISSLTTTLSYVSITGCLSLTSANISNLTNLTVADLHSNPSLTSVRAVNVGGAMNYSAYSYWTVGQGINVKDCLLSGTALNQLYTDLASTPAANIFVFNNIGGNDDDPTIATAKGYAVYGSYYIP